MAGFWQQLKALLKRNILLKKRNKIQLLQEIFFPIYFVAILGMIRWMFKPEEKPAVSFPVYSLNDSRFGTPFSASKYIYAVPDNSQVDTWMKDIVSQLNGPPQYKMFQSIEDAESMYKDNSGKVAAGIVFNNSGDPYSYAIRVDYDDIPSTTGFFSNKGGSCRDDNGTSTDARCEANKYLSSGFAQLQIAVDNVIMKDLGLSTPDPDSRDIQVHMMDKPKYLPDSNFVQTISSIYFVISFAFLVSYLAVNIVAEKEKKIKDGMLMMGLRSSAFWLSWAIIYMAMIMISTIIMVGIVVGSKYFRHSNMFLLYIAFLLYGSSLIAFAFMITPFFNNAKVAGAVTAFSTIMMSCLYLVVSQTRDEFSYDSNVPAGVQWLMCLLSPLAFATFIDQGLFLELRADGFGFDDSLTYGKFPLYAPLLMLAFDTVLYSLLTVYFDRVVPGEYGVRYPPHYFLQKSYWCPSSHAGEKHRLINKAAPARTLSHAVDVEPVPMNMENKVAMRISSLTKTFKADGKVNTAVNGFSLDIYESQITCLLGHNGAGKSTLMNMLTGVIPPTSGSATIMDLDITNPSELEKIRARCGICPQHNILYDNLSCWEHLQLFANIKGVPKNLVNETVEKALEEVDLQSQTDTFARDLSGGQKRKLSVAIALIGDPKLIFLDEPTAGMDPYSRRHLWSLLKKKKEGRVVLLTTHFMDEADILADRKAFIRKGKLRCCGSSLFLKNKFGVGYHLIMVVTPNCEVEKVTGMLKSTIPDIEHHRTHGKELSYTVPLTDVSKFSTLFGQLDQKSEGLGIRNYGVSMTTLEEVFLKLEADEVADTVDDDDEDNGVVNQTFSANHDDVNIDLRNATGNGTDLNMIPSVSGSRLSKQRFLALFKIRFLLMIRNIKAIIFQVVLPVTLVIAGLALLQTDEAKPAPYPTQLPFNPHFYVRSAESPANASLPPLLVFDSLNNTDSQAVIANWENVLAVDAFASGSENTSGVAPHNVGLQMNNLSGKVLMDLVVLYNDTAMHSLPVAINLATQAMLNMSNIKANVNTTSFPWPQNKALDYSPGAYSSAQLIGLAFILVLPGFASEIVQDRQWKLRSQLRISGISFNIYWGTIYLSDLLVYLIPALTIVIVVMAWQIPGLNSGGAVGGLILLFITNIPFNIVMALVLSFIFDKAETCVAYLPLLLIIIAMGPYLAVSLIDMLAQSNVAVIIHYLACFITPPYIVFGGFYFINRVNLIAVNRGEEVTSSDYFDVENHVIITIIAPIIHFVWMYWLLRVLDVRKTGGKVKEAFPCFSRSIDTSPALNTDTFENEDNDVITERARIENLHSADRRSSAQGLTNLRVKEPVAYTSQLRKVFVKRTRSHKICRPGTNKLKVAVRNLSIGVDRGEVLGLLGPNGAGKSTALNMMIAETEPTCGKVVVSGHNIRSNMLSVLESLGYCPQHDALWETITLEEHLNCFAAIKGMDPRQLEDIVDYYIRSLKLEEHRDKRSKTLSGGTKRKLSYIMSMLGSPHFVLLDEPSTGMDPQSKRFLWDTISSSFSNTDKGAILTTHYMEEADALCGRVGIMVNGQLQCMGSTQHLKSKYGSGYILEVKLGTFSPQELEQLMDKLEAHLRDLFPGMEKVERFMERAQYSIPKEDVKSLGQTFASLESCKNSHGLEEYSFSQSSLEQVFLYFAKKQIAEGDDTEHETSPPSPRVDNGAIPM